MPERILGELPALQGLPEYGVLLTGTPQNPVIENHSGRTVIAYVLIAAGQDGGGPVYQILLATTMQPAGIPDGGSLYAIGSRPVNPTVQMKSPAQMVSPFHGPIVSATLRCVIFADVEAFDFSSGLQFGPHASWRRPKDLL